MADNHRMQVFCERSQFRNRIDLFLVDTDPDTGARAVGKLVEMQAIPDDGAMHTPTMRLTLTAAQQLMDELWTCGIRPSEGQGSAGAMAATRDHLKDMQRIAFMLLEDGGAYPQAPDQTKLVAADSPRKMEGSWS